MRPEGPTDADDDEVEKVIKQHGCQAAYYKLEECLGEHDRDWRACQKGEAIATIARTGCGR